MSIAEIQEKITPILRLHDIKKASLFGSFARGDEKSDSDVDLLVQLGKPMGMIAYVRFIQEMEDILHRSVDVITDKSLNAHIKSAIETDLRTIYES
jgi:predicted nucleotidyltransferase